MRYAVIVIVTVIGVAGCFKPEVPPIEFVAARDAVDLGHTAHTDSALPTAPWSILNTGGVPLVVTPLRLDGEGGTMVSWGSFPDYTTIQPEGHATIDVSLTGDRDRWDDGAFEPQLVIEVGALWNDPRDWANDPTWTTQEVLVPVGFTIACDLDHDGSEATTCGGDDCADTDPTSGPGAIDTCNGVDDDCDGLVDEDGDAVWYADSDGDGYGDPLAQSLGCECPEGYVSNADDCDDTTSEIRPGGVEVCGPELRDEDCDGLIDTDDPDATPITWYVDGDGDGYGWAPEHLVSCAQPTSYVADDTDCDDLDATISPGGIEVCGESLVDEDCDGLVNELDPDAVAVDWYADADGDGSGDASVVVTACEGPAGHVQDASDCDDGDPAVSPFATELDNGVDEDCDEWIDEDFVAAGDVVISEIFSDPAALVDEGHRWVEVTAASDRTIALDGWEVRVDDGATSFSAFISPQADLELAPGGTLVLCEESTTIEASWTSVSCDYEVGTASNGYTDSMHGPATDPDLAPRSSGDTVSIRLDALVVDEVAYGSGWPLEEGASLTLDPDSIDATANDSAARWCAGATALDDDNRGTPGAENDSCNAGSDTGASDTGASDTGASDTGASDTGASDTGASDTGASDTGASDSGT